MRVFSSTHSEVEMRDMAAITEKAMVNLFHQGGTTSLAPASSLERLGPKGSLLFLYYLNKIKLQIGVHDRELTFFVTFNVLFCAHILHRNSSCTTLDWGKSTTAGPS